MSRATLVCRLGWRDVTRRATESLLLLLALGVAATTLTVGLVLHGQIGTPYAQTRAATRGPDLIGYVFPDIGRPLPAARVKRLRDFAREPSVVATSGLLPQTWASLHVHGLTAVAEVQGRSRRPAVVDRPRVVSGTWLRPGGAVVERAFAEALGVRVGDRLRLGGHPVRVDGIAVSAALPAYPQMCTVGCILDQPGWQQSQPGLVWLNRSAVLGLATHREPVTWFSFLRLRSPRAAPTFAARHGSPSLFGPALIPWQDIARRHAETLRHERTLVLFGSSLLIVMALATVVVLVGGRMADEVRRVGALKALGASPGFVVRMLLASYLAISVVAAGAGLLVGRLLAPALVTPSAGLLGHSGSTSMTGLDILVVLATMVTVVLVSSVVPAWRAARTSTVRALADAGRRPRRSRSVIALSAHVPTVPLLGLRLAARRPRRSLLTAASIAIAVCGAVVVLYARASIGTDSGPAGGPANPNARQLHTVMLALTVLLALMAAVNLVFATRAAAAEARGTLAVVRALGATPAESAGGLVLAQVVPAVVGMVVGLVSGVLLFRAVAVSAPVFPGVGQMIALVLATIAVTAGLTALPTRLESRRSVAEVLRDA